MGKHAYVTDDNGGRFNIIAATIIVILLVVGLLYFAGAVPHKSADQLSGAISAQEQSPKQGVIKPPNAGDTGIHTTVPHPNADSDMEMIPPLGTPGGEPR